jgi:hypothetical protein
MLGSIDILTWLLPLAKKSSSSWLAEDSGSLGRIKYKERNKYDMGLFLLLLFSYVFYPSYQATGVINPKKSVTDWLGYYNTLQTFKCQ